MIDDYVVPKERADKCVSHHHACDCREYAYKQRIEALEAVEKIALDLVNRDIKWREALHRFQTILLPGRGDD